MSDDYAFEIAVARSLFGAPDEVFGDHRFIWGKWELTTPAYLGGFQGKWHVWKYHEDKWTFSGSFGECIDFLKERLNVVP